ncbi:MAG: hypothetical protein Q3988_01485 [Gemella sp.]|nr:hypothetical protein [Gemella sp.]
MNVLKKKTFLKLLACIMVVTQSILVALVATFYLNNVYLERVMNFSEQAVTIKIRNTNSEKNTDIYNYLEKSVKDYNLFYARVDTILGENSSNNSIIIGLHGDVESNQENINLSYLEQTVLDKEKIIKLQESDKTDASIGLDLSSAKMVSDIPKFVLGDKLVFKKLSNLIETSGTVNGEYKILGLSETEADKFLSGLAEVSGVKKETFTDNSWGRFMDSSFTEFILLSLLFSHSLILLSIFSYLAISNLKNLGTLILQGWSRVDFIKYIYKSLVWLGVANIPLSIVYGSIFVNHSFSSYLFYSIFLLAGFLSFILLLILISLASILIFLVKPISAIKDRFPKKIYLTIAGFFYVVFSAILVYVCIYLDGPYKEIERSAGISKQWKNVETINILEDIGIGNDYSSFSLQSNKFNKDFYNWYRSIQNEKGVDVVTSSKFTREQLNEYRISNLFKSVADDEFWQIKATPNYLIENGVNLSQELIDKTKAGKRIYLVPSDLYKENLIEMLREIDLSAKGAGSIQTKFTENLEIEFVKYNEEIKLFSWQTNINEQYAKNPVILLLSADNMVFSELESLAASGSIDNSLVKLSEDAKNKFTNNEYMEKFGLDDNNIKFSSVSKFVDGLQKDLWKTIYLFGSVVLAITFILVVLLVVIFLTFELANKEKIAVKQFLGYSKKSIYKYPLIFVVSVVLIELLFVLMFWSKLGIIYIMFVILLHILLVTMVIRNNGIDKTTKVFKS